MSEANATVKKSPRILRPGARFLSEGPRVVCHKLGDGKSLPVLREAVWPQPAWGLRNEIESYAYTGPQGTEGDATQVGQAAHECAASAVRLNTGTVLVRGQG